MSPRRRKAMKHPITSPRRPSRIDIENVVLMLCNTYPKSFFEDPRQRQPLKDNIAADIIADPELQVSPAMIAAAVEWYESHVSYDYVMSAGSKRIDLDGRAVGTVTEQEARAARHRIDEFNHRRNELAKSNPARVLREMHASGSISDDAMKKLDAAPRSKPLAVATEFAPLYETLTAANAAVVGISDPTLRVVVAKALLDEVIKRCEQQRLILDAEAAR
jgi:sRNA-binding protein